MNLAAVLFLPLRHSNGGLTMSTSNTIRSSLALAIAAFALCAGAMTAQAATVVSSAHYQTQIVLSDCTTIQCLGTFPAPGANHRLNITRINCYLLTLINARFEWGHMDLVNANNKVILAEYLPIDFDSSDGQQHVLNQALDIQVAATQHINVAFDIEAGHFIRGTCTGMGTLDTLR
jgi:hypothetical protein